MQGLRTCIYLVADIQAAKEWYSKAFETNPYFDEPYYVGYDIDGYELGLQPQEPDTKKNPTVMTYWGVENIDQKYIHLLACGAKEHEKPHNVGGDIMVASVFDPFDNIIGIIYNTHFKLT